MHWRSLGKSKLRLAVVHQYWKDPCETMSNFMKQQSSGRQSCGVQEMCASVCQEKEEQHSRALEALPDLWIEWWSDRAKWSDMPGKDKMIENTLEHIWSGYCGLSASRMQDLKSLQSGENSRYLQARLGVSGARWEILHCMRQGTIWILYLCRTKTSQIVQSLWVSTSYSWLCFVPCCGKFCFCFTEACWRPRPSIVTFFLFGFTDSAWLDTSQQFWEVKDEEHRKKLEDLMQQGSHNF